MSSIIDSNGLLCDAQINASNITGTTIGMDSIKTRRLNELTLNCHPELYVGQCVPFYFCPRSIMLYLIHMANNEELSYQGGQESIIHLQADLHDSVLWANQKNRRWAFTLSNAGSYYFEDRNNLAQLNELDWQSINANQWSRCKEGKQAEFLTENCFPWHLIESIGVKTQSIATEVMNILRVANHKPTVQIQPNWYY